jgi:hypothetical protein
LLPFVIASTLELNPMRTQVSSSLTQPSWSMPLCLSPLSKKAVNNTLLIGPYPQFRSTFYLFTLICKPALNPKRFKALAYLPSTLCLSPSKKRSTLSLLPFSLPNQAHRRFTYLSKKRSMPFLLPLQHLCLSLTNALNLCMSRLSSSPIGPALKYGTWKKREREIRLSSRTNL